MTPLTNIPNEIFDCILSLLPNSDIKNLRLTCSHICRLAHLRLGRVFLSPHPRDIQVFRAIADHETFRELVFEMVYDDARLSARSESGQFELDTRLTHDAVPAWFAHIYERQVIDLAMQQGKYVLRPDHIQTSERLNSRLSLVQSYAQYQRIIADQTDSMAAAADVKAFQYGLERFPNLCRVVVTPIAHGLLFKPRYETPMIRSLPHGFIYPVPQGWPTSSEHSSMPVAKPWESEREKVKWRGVRLVLSNLANHSHKVTEFIIDVNQLLTGLSWRVFDEPNQEYDDMIVLLRTPNFSRLDLALFVGGQDDQHWLSYRTGLLHRALAEAKDMRHFSFASGLVPPESVQCPEPYGSDGSEHFISLRSLFPVDQWKQLRHFGLSRFIVKQDDVVELLAGLPPTLRSVELSFLSFLKIGGGSYRGLLLDIRDKLEWNKRHVSIRPRITIYVDADPAEAGCCVDVTREAESFIYHDSSNPFTETRFDRGNRIWRSNGTGIERFAFNPRDDRPFVHDEVLVSMGVFMPDHKGDVAIGGGSN